MQILDLGVRRFARIKEGEKTWIAGDSTQWSSIQDKRVSTAPWKSKNGCSYGNFDEWTNGYWIHDMFEHVHFIQIESSTRWGIFLFVKDRQSFRFSSGWWFQGFFIFSPTWGKWSNLTCIYIKMLQKKILSVCRRWIPGCFWTFHFKKTSKLVTINSWCLDMLCCWWCYGSFW